MRNHVSSRSERYISKEKTKPVEGYPYLCCMGRLVFLFTVPKIDLSAYLPNYFSSIPQVGLKSMEYY